MKPIIYIFLFLISFTGVSQIFSDAQLYQIDSLNVVINNPNSHDTSLAKSYLVLSEILYISNIDTLKYLCEKSKLIAEKSLLKNNSEKVQKSLRESLARALNNIGYINYSKGKIIEALDYFSHSLKIQEEIGDKEGIANSFNNIGVIYYDQGQLNEAIDYYSRSLKIYEEIGNKEGAASSLNNIGAMYIVQEQLIEALDYFSRSLKIEEEIGDRSGIANSLTNLGSIYMRQEEIEKALIYYSRSLKIQEEIGDKSGIASSLNNIGTIYKKQGKLVEALEYGLKSLTISQEIGSPLRIRQASRLLSIIYEKQGKGMKAFEMYKLTILMRDSLENKETQNAATQQEAKYEHEKQKTIDDAAHNKILAVEQEEKEKQQILTVAIAVGLGLVILFSLFILNRFRVTYQQKNVIQDQHQKLEHNHLILEEAHKDITDSIVYAKRIQDATLTSNSYIKDVLPQSFLYFNPKELVSGDFYWVFSDEDNVFFTVADCTGHGVPGAFMSMIGNSLLNEMIIENKIKDTNIIMDKVSNKVKNSLDQKGEQGQSRDGMDMALCRLNKKTKELMFTGAKNPLLLIRDGEIIEYKGDKRPVGYYLGENILFKSKKIKLKKNDMIYVFSDGYSDQFGGQKGKKYKTENFKRLLLSIADKDTDTQHNLLRDEFENWKGDLEQLDDVCVMGLRI